MLGQGSYFFHFILESEEIDIHRFLEGDVTVQFIKGQVSFNIYFHEQISHRMWFVDEVMIDLLSHWKVETPNDIFGNVEAPSLEFAAFWNMWLRPALQFRAEENPFYTNLAQLIANDIMRFRKINKRNVLHEMTQTRSVSVYFSLGEDNYLNLRLKAPTAGVLDTTTSDAREELKLLILSIHVG